MFNSTNHKNQIIKQIIEKQKNIKNIYDSMNIQNKEEKQNELKRQIKEENILLDALNIKNKNIKEIYDIYVEELSNNIFNFNEQMIYRYQEITKKDKTLTNDLLLERFENYIIDKVKESPVLSENNNDKDKERENNATITHIIKKDINNSILKSLKETEEKDESIENTNTLLTEINKLSFSDKTLEYNYLYDTFTNMKHKKLLEYGHDEAIISEIFSNILAEKLNNQYLHCYLYTDEQLNNKVEKAKFITDLAIFQGQINLLNTKAIKDIYMAIETSNLNKEKESVNYIKESLHDVIYKKENNKKALKKLTK